MHENKHIFILFYTTSAQARVNASSILICITSARIDSWKSAAELFILNWRDPNQTYESLVKSESCFL